MIFFKLYFFLYRCECPVGFKGKKCDEMEFCKITDCPEGSRCQNLVYGYECVANVTLTGNASGLQYRLVRGEHSSALDSVRISYRTHDGGTLLHITALDQPHKYFTISTSNDQVPISNNILIYLITKAIYLSSNRVLILGSHQKYFK